MGSHIAWSHSRRKDFLECPRMFFHKNVAKKGSSERVEFAQTPQMLAGVMVDDALSRRISQKTPLPPQYAPYEEMVSMILAAPGAKFSQLKVALDQTFKPCGYMEWGVTWCRAIYDVAVIDGSRGFIGDFKAGQIWLDESQLQLFAATAFHTFPELEVVSTSYIWLKHGVTTDREYSRNQLPEMWSELLPAVERMQVAYRTNHWPAQPARGAKSCSYCGVNAKGLCASAMSPYKGK